MSSQDAKESKSITSILFWLAILILVVIGYINNIVELVGAENIMGLELARIAGIFVFPLGAILGFV